VVSEALLAIPFGVGIGLSLGMVGGGGSVLAVPVLVYVLDQPVKEATTASLLVVGTAALAGAVDHTRIGQVHVRTAVAFGTAGAVGAIAGTTLNRLVSGQALLLAFALLLLAAAIVMLVRRDALQRRATASLARVGAVGAGTGVLTGFFGVGGGFLIVPALVLLLGLPLTLAVGTSLLVIALTSAAALAAHLASGTVDWAIALPFTAGAIVGALAGRRLGAGIQPQRLRRLFAVLLIAVAALIVTESVSAQPPAGNHSILPRTALSSYGPIRYGRIISWSSCSTIWQCQTKSPARS
jgi:uncharacterized membrane protein YfcA